MIIRNITFWKHWMFWKLFGKSHFWVLPDFERKIRSGEPWKLITWCIARYLKVGVIDWNGRFVKSTELCRWNTTIGHIVDSPLRIIHSTSVIFHFYLQKLIRKFTLQVFVYIFFSIFIIIIFSLFFTQTRPNSFISTITKST